MKHWKKLLVAVAAVVMAMAMAVPAFAATGTVSMNIADGDTHEYKVYQVFTGDLSGESGHYVLSNVKYGTNYGTEGDAVGQDVLAGITDGDAFARSIEDELHGNPVGTLKAGTTSLTVDTGYYMIVDDTAKTLSTGDAYSAYIVEVVGPVTIQPKKDTTTSDKTIIGEDHEDSANTNKKDNVNIGDTVNFMITATIPSHATDYDYYFFIINDTLSQGLTLQPGSIKVYENFVYDDTKTVAENIDANSSKLITDYAVYTGNDVTPNSGHTFEVALTDAISHAGKTITVLYDAKLNANAAIGENPNTNTNDVTYSNNPNHSYEGDVDDNNPGKPASTEDVPLGETPDKTTETYTTGLKIKKVDQDGNPLTGAEFTLTGTIKEVVIEKTTEFVEDANGAYWKLANGAYTTTPPVTADRMDPAPDGANAGYVIDNTYTGDDKVVIGETTYRPYKTGDEGTIYIHVKANASLYDDVDQKYSKKTSETPVEKTSTATAVATVGADGIVEFDGLGSGTYTVTETETPAGYNTVAPLEVTFTWVANPTEGNHWVESTGANCSYNATAGVYEIEVINQKGNVLPSTGGMGTTILYIIGGIMVLLAVVFLITKKRVAATKKDATDDIL
jgi:fimbrial isopeptide formation D2 family protein/LPXTG-motif cell wall-anchored protein